MIANSANPYPQDVPSSFTLNELRVQNTVADIPSSGSALTVAGVAAAVVLAITAFVWIDPLHLHLLAPTVATSPTPPTSVPKERSAQPTESQEITAPLAAAPAPKSVEAPAAPALTAPALTAPAPMAPAPVAQAPQLPAPVIQPRAAGAKPSSPRSPTAKSNTNTRIAQNSTSEITAPPALSTPEERAAPPVLAKPEEKNDAPIVPKVGEGTVNAPKPATTNDQAPPAE